MGYEAVHANKGRGAGSKDGLVSSLGKPLAVLGGRAAWVARLALRRLGGEWSRSAQVGTGPRAIGAEGGRLGTRPAPGRLRAPGLGDLGMSRPKWVANARADRSPRRGRGCRRSLPAARSSAASAGALVRGGRRAPRCSWREVGDRSWEVFRRAPGRGILRLEAGPALGCRLRVPDRSSHGDRVLGLCSGCVLIAEGVE